MKKIISLALVFVMIMSLGIAAFAADIEATDGSANGEVKATYVASNNVGGTVFSVDVEWTNLQFTYNEGSEATWNATDHEYNDDAVAEGWVESAEQITVTNHSNATVTATPSYLAETGYEAVTMKFSRAPIIASAALDNQAHTAYIAVVPDGKLPNTATTETKIGTITITISEYELPGAERMCTDINSAKLALENIGKASEEDMQVLADAMTVASEYNNKNATYERLVLAWAEANNTTGKYYIA